MRFASRKPVGPCPLPARGSPRPFLGSAPERSCAALSPCSGPPIGVEVRENRVPPAFAPRGAARGPGAVGAPHGAARSGAAPGPLLQGCARDRGRARAAFVHGAGGHSIRLGTGLLRRTRGLGNRRPPRALGLSAGSLREPPRRISHAGAAGYWRKVRRVGWAAKRGDGAEDAPWERARSARALSPGARGGRRRSLQAPPRSIRTQLPQPPNTYSAKSWRSVPDAGAQGGCRGRRAVPPL
jgi:hypothetical protein